MAEFVFRNLSVKLFPAADAAQGPVCVCCSYAHECDECSFCTEGVTDPPCDPCTGGVTDPPECGPCTDGPTDPPGCEGPSDDCFPCTDFDTSPCTFSDEEPCEEPLSCVQESGCFADSDLPIFVVGDDPAQPAVGRAPRSPDVIQAELDVLRVELRAALGLPPDEDPQRRVPEAAPAPEDIDRVRSALLAAVDELDEKRGRTGDAPWPG